MISMQNQNMNRWYQSQQTQQAYYNQNSWAQYQACQQGSVPCDPNLLGMNNQTAFTNPTQYFMMNGYQNQYSLNPYMQQYAGSSPNWSQNEYELNLIKQQQSYWKYQNSTPYQPVNNTFRLPGA
jgi:hypothetical protein